tara:strand:+ start:15869 stop:16720 length:852 start_codon:yes stop_codon:yes gene_type:complete
MYLKQIKGLYKVNFTEHPVVELKGPEHKEWLYTISSQAFAKDRPNICSNAFLKADGGLIAAFMQASFNDKTYLFLNPYNKDQALEHLDFCHFGEDLEFTLLEGGYQRWFVDAQEHLVENHMEEGFIVFSYPGLKGCEVFTLKDLDLDLPEKNFADLRFRFFQQGVPISGLDISVDNMILEGPFDDYVTDEKGCYPGQETIAKVYTYGRKAKSFYRAQIEKIPENTAITCNEAKCGDLVSYFDYNQKHWAWLRISNAFVKKWQQGEPLVLGEENLKLIDMTKHQ